MRAAAIPVALILALAGPALAQPVTIDLIFSDKALAELQKRGEGIVVSAYFSGDPAPGATLIDPEMGTVFLMTEELTLHAGPGQVVLGTSLAAAPLNQVIEPKLNVNVFSGRWTDDNNLLDCNFLDDTVAVLAAKPQTIGCKLIGE
jgi:hypothetical protein